MPRVLITDYVFESIAPERAVLERAGVEVVVAPATDEQSLIDAVANVDGMLVCFAAITPAVVQAAAAGGCRVIARYGIGYDNVAVDEATRHGIVVTNVPDYCLGEVADHTMALLLALARGVVAAAKEVAAGRWPAADPGIRRLAGRRLTLLGLGGIGSRVAIRAQAFDLDVTAFDPYVDSTAATGVTLAGSLEEALVAADFVSLHVPYTAANHHLINRTSLALIPPGCCLINTARGGLVDTEAVVDALVTGQLAGVALDVLEAEPLALDHPLRTHERAIITPHIAFHSVEATEELQRRAAAEALRVVSGGLPERPVNPCVLNDAG